MHVANILNGNIAKFGGLTYTRRMARIRLRRRHSGGARKGERGGMEGMLFSVFGPAQVGRYDPTPPEPIDAICPACEHAFSEHEIDRSTGRSFIRCPEDPESQD
jgi:hypothetical protein